MKGNFEELYMEDTDYNSSDGLRKFFDNMTRKYKTVAEAKIYDIIYEITGYTRDQISPKKKAMTK